MSIEMNPIIFDNFTIITSLALILLSIVTPMLNPFFRFSKKDANHSHHQEPPLTDLPPLSVVLTPMDDIEGLRNNLPHLLRQDYPAGFQVIVVIEQGDHDAEAVIGHIRENVLTPMASASTALYVTYIPKSSRYISRKKLAITLGIKAAQTEWVVLTETTCRPASDQWLKLMARHCSDERNMVIGYGRYADDTSSYRRFERMHTSFYLMRETAKHTAYRDNSNNLMFRKSEFMGGDGYLGNLNLMRGEYDFLVNKHARKLSTALEASDGAWMVEDAPTKKSWLNRHVYYLESRKYLRRSKAHRLWFNLDQSFLHLNACLIIAAGVYAGITQRWVLLAAASLALIITIVFRTLLCRKALHDFGEDLSPLAAFVYEHTVVWHRLWYIIRYRLSDQSDFTTHKL